MEALYRSLQISSGKNGSDWPLYLVSALPQLLAKLLDQEFGESLERIQVVSVAINLVGKSLENSKPEFRDIKISRADGPNSFLMLSGDLLVGETKALDIAINYFVRGQRKFFKPAHAVLSLTKKLALFAISKEDVASFFNELEQGNSLWFQQKLAELNGRASPSVPSQMMVALLLSHGLRIFANDSYKHFHISFLKSVKIGQEVAMAYGHNQDGLHLVVATDQEPALWLKATC